MRIVLALFMLAIAVGPASAQDFPLENLIPSDQGSYSGLIIQGLILFFSFLYILLNLLIDIVYTLIDPRIRY